MRYLWTILLVFGITHCIAQLIPADNAVLNYRLAGFSVPEYRKASGYLFEIATDSIIDNDNFKSHVVLKQSSKQRQVIETLPYWGKHYTWRVSFLGNRDNIISSTPLYHFSTGYNKFADSSAYRLHVITNKIRDRNMLVFIDGTKTLYTVAGDPVWFLPDIPGVTNPRSVIRDLKITPQNTITFLTQKNAYEIDYNGKVLWTAPNNGKVNGDSTENYHHEFTRLANGNYMITGNARIWLHIPNDVDTAITSSDVIFRKSGDSLFKFAEFGTLIEYDAKGNVLWSWKTSEHIAIEDLVSRKLPRGNIPDTRTHLNAFYFDEQHNHIYISYRDINRIIKIKYPEGNVLTSYGESYIRNQYRLGDGYFRVQHACRINSDGNLMVFNNNNVNVAINPFTQKKQSSTILILKEPKSPKDTLEKLWEFSCAIDSLVSPSAGNGGNAMELKNGSIIACMGSVPRCFIVNRKKEVEWNAILEVSDKGTWTKSSAYRIFPVEDSAVVEHLLFDQ